MRKLISIIASFPILTSCTNYIGIGDYRIEKEAYNEIVREINKNNRGCIKMPEYDELIKTAYKIDTNKDKNITESEIKEYMMMLGAIGKSIPN